MQSLFTRESNGSLVLSYKCLSFLLWGFSSYRFQISPKKSKEEPLPCVVLHLYAYSGSQLQRRPSNGRHTCRTSVGTRLVITAGTQGNPTQQYTQICLGSKLSNQTFKGGKPGETGPASVHSHPESAQLPTQGNSRPSRVRAQHYVSRPIPRKGCWGIPSLSACVVGKSEDT